eukprot:TRINITY_DN3885_c0_g1_i1.p1 TRINITY_DN3885_c0_g1~~TRINITY_DN3885_c0_g1_i1.p1  ORF type:complete len:493 (-),score=109.07 TRINITY_DN3885_c0_g1_i1:67-1545(-)
MESLAKATGLPLDQVILASCCLLSLPLGVVVRRMPGATSRMVFGLVVGLWFGVLSYGWGLLHSILSTLAAYAVLRVNPAKQAHRVVFVLLLGHLLLSHLYNMVTAYMSWNVDFTAAQLIILAKVTQTAFSIYDGRRKEEDLFPEEREDRITEFPTLLEFASYIFFFPSFLVGPAFTFNQFRSYVRRPSTPPSLVPTAKKLLQVAVTYVGMHLSGRNPITYCLTDAFVQDHPLWWRVGYMWLSVVLYRFKYYLCWLLAEAGCIACGLAYNGKVDPAAGATATGATASTATGPAEKERDSLGAWRFLSCYVDGDGNRWDLTKNVDVLNAELAQNVKGMTDNWNIHVGRWLRVYVYQRMCKNNKSKPPPYAVLVTQLTSALWHGFYPGYYTFFVSCSLLTSVARLSRRHIRPLFLGNKFRKAVYDFLSFVCTGAGLNTIGIAFCLLDAKLGFTAWRNIGFVTHIIGFVLLFALTVFEKMGAKSKKPRSSQEPKKE